MTESYKIYIKRRFWFGWRVIECVSHQWVAGRTVAVGLEYKKETNENKPEIVTKVSDYRFDMQLAITYDDGSVEYIPKIEHKRIIISKV